MTDFLVIDCTGVNATVICDNLQIAAQVLDSVTYPAVLVQRNYTTSIIGNYPSVYTPKPAPPATPIATVTSALPHVKLAP